MPFKQILTALSFASSGVHIKNFRTEKLAADPTTNIDQPGRIWYNTTEKTWKSTVLNASGQVVIESAATRAEIQAIAATANSQATAISDLQTSTTSINATISALGTTYLKRDGSTAMTGTLDFGSNRAVNVGSATASTDGVNKGDVTTAISTATANLVSTDAMNTAISTAMSQHVTGVLKFSGQVRCGSYDKPAQDAASARDIIADDSIAAGLTAGSAFTVTYGTYSGGATDTSKTSAFFKYGPTGNAVEAKVGDWLVIAPNGELIVDDNTQAGVSAGSGYVSVTGSASTGFIVDISNDIKTASDAAVLKDGTRAMTGALDMGNHVINNVQQAATKFEAVNLGQVQNIATRIGDLVTVGTGGGVAKAYTGVANGTIIIDGSYPNTGDASKYSTDIGGVVIPTVTTQVYVKNGSAWEHADVFVSVEIGVNGEVTVNWNADVTGDYILMVHPTPEFFDYATIETVVQNATNLTVV